MCDQDEKILIDRQFKKSMCNSCNGTGKNNDEDGLDPLELMACLTLIFAPLACGGDEDCSDCKGTGEKLGWVEIYQ